MSSIVDAYLRLGPLETRISTHARYSETADDVEADVIAAADIRPDDALLDIGPGTGSFLRRLRAERAHTGRLSAVDLSPAAVAAAASVERVDAVLGDAAALPYANGSFDVVTARHMLYHVPDPHAAVREAHRVLRPGGRLAATVNVAGTMPLINGVVSAVLAGLGLPEGHRPELAVHSGNLPSITSRVFGDRGTVLRRDNALVFDAPEPVIAYCLSMLSLRGVPDDHPRHEQVATALVQAVRAKFDELDGRWRDPKGYVVCVAVKGTDTAADTAAGADAD